MQKKTKCFEFAGANPMLKRQHSILEIKGINLNYTLSRVFLSLTIYSNHQWNFH